ncbi:hypothetical protein M0R45_035191 [Rubus argutus]|uniref:Uncharacterized protein n=1 Tax=Rubus argutus TaxID=59490 RepID=A0AAW1VU38_RUBAR
MFDLRRAMNLGLEFRKEWLQQNFPCLCEHISIVIQLSFLGILLLLIYKKAWAKSASKEQLSLTKAQRRMALALASDSAPFTRPA